ncbi:phage portal protein [Zavarzinella formosa]|uniref:phage portal protein n=1 Tax=Zavarzinella formosa TaxID=360055 RepID=UPI0012F7C3E1|nr:phage portal protein [Zavarzinella formosa]
MRARYDAAQTNDQNKRHWSNADDTSPNSANLPGVRQTLRRRSRYEAANNGFCKGLLRTLRNDVIGIGPRLQLSLPATWIDPDFQTKMATPENAAHEVERRFKKWLKAAGIAQVLRIMQESSDRDGEVFGVFVTNPKIQDRVHLTLRAVEADQCTTPTFTGLDPLAVDGIRFDEFGNSVEFHFLKYHPRDPYPRGYADFDRVDGRYVVHWYDPDRPGQRRGIPALTASLPLYATLRRYGSAVLAAAETAANHAAVLTTDQPPPEGTPPDDDLPENFDRIPLPQNGGVTLPYGWSLTQMDAKQPTTTFPQHQATVLTETGAPVCAPRNVSTKSSAEYNYSSARLDHLPYRRSIEITRDRSGDEILDRLFLAWLQEALLIEGHLPDGLPPVCEWEWVWQWQGFESIDPVKDATAIDIGLKNGTLTLAEVLANRGIDWEEHLAQKAREQDKLNEYGLSAVMIAATGTAMPAGDGEDGANNSSASQAAASGGVQATALNGAQFDSLLGLADRLAAGTFNADSAKALVKMGFPLISDKLILRFVDGLVSAPKPPATEGATSAATQTA